MHICRGNFVQLGSPLVVMSLSRPYLATVMWTVSSLEYDSDRAGDFKPLRFIKINK